MILVLDFLNLLHYFLRFNKKYQVFRLLESLAVSLQMLILYIVSFLSQSLAQID